MSRWYYFLMAVIPIVIFIFFPRWLVDDSYIYFRYAANLAQAGAPVWNIGETPVEGYTGIVWLLLLAAGIKLGVSPLLASHVFGVSAYFLGFLLLILIFRRLETERAGIVLALLLYGTMPVLFTHALSGLETMLFLSVMLAALCASLSLSGPRQGRREAIFWGALLLLSLVRPEGIALSLLLALSVGYFFVLRSKEAILGYILRFFIFFFVPLAIYFFWRHGYYGNWFPNTFYAKTNIGFSWQNLADLFRFLRSYFAVPLVACVIILLPEIDSVRSNLSNLFKTKDRLRLAIALAGLFFLAVLTVQFFYSHLTMNYAYRFYVPFLPFILIGIGVLFGAGWKALWQSRTIKPLRFKLSIIVLLFLGGYQFLFHFTKLRAEMKFAREEQISLERQHIAIGKWLKGTVPLQEWLVVYIDAGAIPYFSGLKAVDFGALNDPFLTNSFLTLSERIDYFFLHNPGAVVFTSENADKFDYGTEAAAIMNDARFKRYTLVKKYLSPLTPPRSYHEFVFLRNDLLPFLK